MTFTNRHPRALQFALILFILLVLPFQTTVLGRKRQANKTRRSATRAEKGKKLSSVVRDGVMKGFPQGSRAVVEKPDCRGES
jgi:hypothetical protein